MLGFEVLSVVCWVLGVGCWFWAFPAVSFRARMTTVDEERRRVIELSVIFPDRVEDVNYFAVGYCNRTMKYVGWYYMIHPCRQ